MKLNVIKTGGKQFVVREGSVITVEKMSDDHKKGDKVSFADVLLTCDGNATNVGAPLISGAAVEGEILEVGRAKKIEVIKYKAKSNYFTNRGHRQPFAKVKITKIA
jgi:large subunit ribosomal protein L21